MMRNIEEYHEFSRRISYAMADATNGLRNTWKNSKEEMRLGFDRFRAIRKACRNLSLNDVLVGVERQ